MKMQKNKLKGLKEMKFKKNEKMILIMKYNLS